jgi:hypothetical protein
MGYYHAGKITKGERRHAIIRRGGNCRALVWGTYRCNLLARPRDNHGQLLRNTQVDQLIQAMATFSSHRAKRLKNRDILLFLIGLVYRCGRGRRCRGSLSRLFGLSGLSSLFRSLNQTNQTNQTDQMNQMGQLPATCREMGPDPLRSAGFRSHAQFHMGLFLEGGHNTKKVLRARVPARGQHPVQTLTRLLECHG